MAVECVGRNDEISASSFSTINIKYDITAKVSSKGASAAEQTALLLHHLHTGLVQVMIATAGGDISIWHTSNVRVVLCCAGAIDIDWRNDLVDYVLLRSI